VSILHRPIEGVIFDFGRVLSEFDFQRFYAAIQRRSALSPDAFASRLHEAHPLGVAYETGDLSSDEFYDAVVRLAALDMPKEEFIRAYADIFSPIPSTWSVVRELKGRVRLGLLSNTTEWHFEHWIKKVSIFPLFDSVTLSYVVRAMKPDPKIYRAALASMNLPPEACVFFDDIEENAAGARALGIHAFQYTSHQQLLSDLASVGITVNIS
jgi:epoxide hydrolase-like predicted phosphatase